jgi:hypothetical protein
MYIYIYMFAFLIGVGSHLHDSTKATPWASTLPSVVAASWAMPCAPWEWQLGR